MDPFIFAVLVGLVLNLVGVGLIAWVVLRRREALAPPADTHGERLARAALASARQEFPGAGPDELMRKAVVIFRELDMSEDGKRDFTDRQAGYYLRAVL